MENNKRYREAEDDSVVALQFIAKSRRMMDDAFGKFMELHDHLNVYVRGMRDAKEKLEEENKRLRAKLGETEDAAFVAEKPGEYANSPIVIDDDNVETTAEEKKEEKEEKKKEEETKPEEKFDEDTKEMEEEDDDDSDSDSDNDSDNDELGDSDVEQKKEKKHKNKDLLHWCDKCNRVNPCEVIKTGDPLKGLPWKESYKCGNAECKVDVRKIFDPHGVPFYCHDCAAYHPFKFYSPAKIQKTGNCGECVSDGHPQFEMLTRAAGSKMLYDGTAPLFHYCGDCRRMREVEMFDKPDEEGFIGECPMCGAGYEELRDAADEEFYCAECKTWMHPTLPRREKTTIEDYSCSCSKCGQEWDRIPARDNKKLYKGTKPE